VIPAAPADTADQRRCSERWGRVPAARHLLGAQDLVDARYRKPLDVLAFAPAVLSPVHFRREFAGRSAKRQW